jgi:membrane associated rhomboid family serine protease
MVLNFEPIFLTFLTVLAVSTVTYIASSLDSDFNYFLVASHRTPWGIVTSLFGHVGVEHLVSNMICLFSFYILFAITNFKLSEKEKSTRIRFVLLVIFSVAVLSNLLWIVLVPNGSGLGSSGIVYAFEGVTFGFALLSSLEFFKLMYTSKCQLKSDDTLVKHYLYNLTVFLALFFLIVFKPDMFLSVSPGVNVFVHGIAFCICLLLTVFIYPKFFLK